MTLALRIEKIQNRAGEIRRCREGGWILPGKRLGAKPRRKWAGIDEIDPDPGLFDLACPDPYQCLEGCGACGIGAGKGRRQTAGSGHKDSAARFGCAKQRLERADEAVIGLHMETKQAVEVVGLGVGDGGEASEPPGTGDQGIEFAKALGECAAKALDPGISAEIERHERRLTAGRADPVVHGFEPAHRPGNEHEVRPFPGEVLGQGRAEAAARPGDDSDPAGETPFRRGGSGGFRHLRA